MGHFNQSRRHAMELMLGGVALLAVPPAFGVTRRIVKYYGDQQVSLPERIERVATTWEAHNSIIAMLGYGNRIVATTRRVHDMPVFRKFVPNIANAIIAGSTGAEINIEELLRVKPDILFVAGGVPLERRQQLEQVGIPVVAFHDNSLSAIVERTLITGEILGPDALRKARDYKEYFDYNVSRVSNALTSIPRNKRLKVLQVSGMQLMTSGRPSLNQDWMDMGGAINIAEKWVQGRQYGVKASMEEVIAANPDAVVVMDAPDVPQILADPAWRTLRAVREGKVYANPRGLFWWCRETSEEALQFLWLAKTLYPDILPKVDMKRETHDFYRRFYGYALTEEEVTEFLHPTS